MKLKLEIFIVAISTIVLLNIGRSFGQPPTCAISPTPNCTGNFFPFPSPPENHDFTFDTFSKYVNGITYNGATTIKVVVNEIVAGTCRWRLHLMADHNAGAVNEWELVTPYGAAGSTPDVDILEVRIRNACNTSLTGNGFVPMQDKGLEIDIITNENLDPNADAGDCGTNVNGPGSYLTNYGEYSFIIDYRIVPGMNNLRPGNYTLTLRYCLTEDN